MDRPPLTLLYVPANRPDRVQKAIASEADVVIVDLEDAVPAADKEAARAVVLGLLEAPPERPLQVRINSIRTAEGDTDVVALEGFAIDVRLPKVSAPDDVRLAASSLPNARLHCLIESAVGLERAFEVASAHDSVVGVSLGEADLGASLGVPSENGLDFARSRIVLAAAAANLPAPAQSAYPHVSDLDGLRASCLRGRRLGMVGRAAIHPAQLETIRQVYLPTDEEVEHARSILASARGEEPTATGAVALKDGRFVDAAVLKAAERTLLLAE